MRISRTGWLAAAISPTGQSVESPLAVSAIPSIANSASSGSIERESIGAAKCESKVNELATAQASELPLKTNGWDSRGFLIQCL